MDQVDPVVQAICNGVSRLQREQIIQDDHPDLYHFCTQLEDLLRIDRKEKATFFGNQKTFWDYFCQALASKRNGHEGIQFVKAINEVTTSEGRGRAFIQFCLMRGCLADTLQQCLLNQQVTNDWFGGRSPLQHPYQSQLLIHSLYDLSDIQFDLGPPTRQLDFQWPQGDTHRRDSEYGKVSWTKNNEVASACCEEAATMASACHLQEAPGWPPPQDFVHIKTDNSSNVLPSIQSLKPTEMTMNIPSLQDCKCNHKEFLQFFLGKIVELKAKLHNFTLTFHKIPDCPLGLDIIAQEFQNDFEIMHTTTYSALSNLETTLPDVAINLNTEQVKTHELVGCMKLHDEEDAKMQTTDENLKARLEELQHKCCACESRCSSLEDRNNWMKEAVVAANVVLANEAQKIALLRSQLDCLKQCNGEAWANGAKAFEAKDANQEQLELVNDKLRKMLTLVTRQQDQIENLKQHLDTSKQENQALLLQTDKLQKVLQKVETVTGHRNRCPQQTTASAAVDSELIQCKESHDESSEPLRMEKESATADHTPNLSSVSKTLTKLHSFIKEKLELEQELESAKEMTSSLMSKVAEQEQKLSHVTLELSDTRTFIAKLQTAFSKLQTNESILRYELREKRRIFNALKLQLEGSRAQWKQIQQKNSVTLLEWQSLRDEFASRHKQESEESGFGEDSSPSADEAVSKETHSPERGAEGVTVAHPDILVDITRSADESLASEEHEDEALDSRGRRLKFLEDQCTLLCKKLTKSAVHCAKLDSKLTSLHDQYGTPHAEDHLLHQSQRNSNRPQRANTAPIFSNTTVHESSVVVEDMLDDLLTNITEVGSPPLSIDPKNDSSGLTTLSTTMDGLGFPAPEERNVSTSQAKQHFCKPSAFVLAHALPKRVEKLKQEKEEMHQVLLTIQNERSCQEKRESMLRAQIDEMQTTQAAKHSENLTTIENLEAQLRQMTNQLTEERFAKQQLQEELQQVIFGREERIQQMETEIEQLQKENQKLQI